MIRLTKTQHGAIGEQNHSTLDAGKTPLPLAEGLGVRGRTSVGPPAGDFSTQASHPRPLFEEALWAIHIDIEKPNDDAEELSERISRSHEESRA